MEKFKISGTTVKLGRTKIGIFLPLFLGGIIENQNSDFVTVDLLLYSSFSFILEYSCVIVHLDTNPAG